MASSNQATSFHSPMLPGLGPIIKAFLGRGANQALYQAVFRTLVNSNWFRNAAVGVDKTMKKAAEEGPKGAYKEMKSGGGVFSKMGDAMEKELARTKRDLERMSGTRK